MITNDEIMQANQRLAEQQESRRAEQEAQDMAFIRQVNEQRRQRINTAKTGYRTDDPDIFVRISGKRPVSVTVKNQKPSKRGFAFWYGTAFGFISTSIIFAVAWAVYYFAI